MENDKAKNTLPRWEIVLLSIYAIAIYLFLCFVVIPSEYIYPHRRLISIFGSSIIPYFLIVGFDMAWLIFVKFLPLKNKRIKILLALLVLVPSAVAVTDIYNINMWHRMMV